MKKTERKKIIEGIKSDVELLKKQLAKLREDKKKSTNPKSYVPRIEQAKKALDRRKDYLKAQKEAYKTDLKG
jgi:hypothetical protein